MPLSSKPRPQHNDTSKRWLQTNKQSHSCNLLQLVYPRPASADQVYKHVEREIDRQLASRANANAAATLQHATSSHQSK